MKELTFFREVKNGRYSVRVYQHETGVYVLDRELHMNPPMFTFYKRYPVDNPFKGETVLVNGEEYWGSRLSWKTAEKLAEKAIEEFEKNKESKNA